MPDKLKVIGVGDFGASNNVDEVIRTYALGSCVAVVLLHAKTRAVGMVHVALPDSSIDNMGKSKNKPGYFADTGIPALINLMRSMKCLGPPPGGGFTVKIAGGANIMRTNDTFQIGKRNALAVKKILWSYGLMPIAEDLGGSISRTVSVSVATGEVSLSSPARGVWTI